MKLPRNVLMLALGGALMLALPNAAAAGHKKDRLFDRLSHIEYQIDGLKTIGDPYRRLDRIDRLQYRLNRIERRIARIDRPYAHKGDRIVDRLQARLFRIEKRTKHRLAGRHGKGQRHGKGFGQGHGHGHGFDRDRGHRHGRDFHHLNDRRHGGQHTGRDFDRRHGVVIGGRVGVY